MSIPGNANPLLLASVGAGAPYDIERSLRFNSGDSAYLSANFNTPTDQDIFTLSMWVKRSALSSTQNLFGVSTSHRLGFTSGNALNLTFGGASALTTTALFRDPSAWYHITWKQSGTSHTLYVNSISVGTATATSSVFNTAVTHQIGAANTANYFNGYLSNIHFIDGQALDPTSFGQFDANGVWQPKAYTGTYGTNGFHLPFSDNSTAAALGTDTSGNSNTWTVNNISVAAGSGNDSLVDTPSSAGTDTGVGGEVTGNYCTWNPLDHAGISFANGNLDISDTSGTYNIVRGTIAVSSGKWYWEVKMGSLSSNAVRVGVLSPEYAISTSTRLPDTGPDGWGLGSATSGSTFASGNTIGLALDLDAGTLEFYKNGSLMATSRSGISGTYAPAISFYTSEITGTFVTNFGQRPFAYTAPSGFKALCTTNLPDPQTITTSGSYTGNGVANGPFVYLNGAPTAMTVNGNAVTFGTHADKLSNGFKIRTTSTTYNQNASTYNYSITSTGDPFKTARAQSNP